MNFFCCIMGDRKIVSPAVDQSNSFYGLLFPYFVQTAVTFPFAFLKLKHSVRLRHLSRPSMQHCRNDDAREKGLLVSGLLHRMGDDGKVETECFCVWGVSPPSCAQVSGNMPFSLCHGHRVGFSHSDRGAMAETNPVPLLMSCQFLWLSLHPDLVKCLRCRTAVVPLSGHRIEKERRPVGHLPLVLFHQSVVW